MGYKIGVSTRLLTILVLIGFFVFPPPTLAIDDGGVVIHRFQAGGSGSGTTQQEYIELFNNSDHDIDVTNWCLEYEGLSSSNTIVVIGCINAENAGTKVYLGSGSSVLFMSRELETLAKSSDPNFAADIVFSTSSNLAASNGLIRLINKPKTTIDMLGWGSKTGEGVPASGNIPGGKILQRKVLSGNKLQDTNDNSADFELISAPGNYSGGGLSEVNDDIPINPDEEKKPEENDTTTPETVCNATRVLVNEILANPSGADTNGGEFVELINDGDGVISLKNCILSTDKAPNMILSDVTLAPSELHVVWLADKLLNGGGTVSFITDTTEDSVLYPALKDDEAWGFYDDTWQLVSPTPGAPNQPRIPPTEKCQAPDIIITEILANPTGADTNGKEFVEFYNQGNGMVSLKNCILSTDKDGSIALPDTPILPGQYYAVFLSDKLLNSGGTVIFNDTASSAITYPKLSDDEAWALINESWQITTVATPGAPNQSSPPKPSVLGANSTPTPCPVGKVRNPETNRCKTLNSPVLALIPCDPGQERNPTTNRCRKIAAASSTLKPCQQGYERNPETNRCRKTSTLGSGLNRTNDPIDQASQSTPLHPAILISLSTLLLGYGLNEYRTDIFQGLGKLKGKLLPKKA